MSEPSHSSDANETTTLLGRIQIPQCGMWIHGRMWKVKSKGAILTLILNYFVSSTLFTLGRLMFNAHTYFPSFLEQPYLPCMAVVVVICCPVTGYMADAHFNRYKIVRFGLWLSWFGMVIVTTTLLLVYTYENQKIIFITGGMVGGVLVAAGLSAYAANGVQFGIDQMPDASSDELSAYIHWYAIGTFGGSLTGRLTYPVQNCPSHSFDGGFFLIQVMISMTMLSLTVCCEFLFRRWLIIEPGCPNSLRMIYRVLKYAASHKYPIRRRAITYTEDEKPSRIDFAKDKYGGPFTTEQVEDVKTFFRIVVVLASAPSVLIPTGLLITSFNFLIISDITAAGGCSLLNQNISYSVSVFGVIIIPLYTFILYPLVRNRIPRTLRRVVLAAGLTVILSTALLILDSVQHALDPSIACMFSDSPRVLNLNKVWWKLPFDFMIAVMLALASIALAEFTCAQSPYSMRGLLIGTLYSVSIFTFPLTHGTVAAWKHFQYDISPSCDFYYFLFQFLFAVAGFIILCFVAKWYKRRRREEEDDQRRIVEEIYDRMLRNQTLGT